MAARHASELELLRFDDEFEGDISSTSLWLAIPPTVSVALLMPTPK